MMNENTKKCIETALDEAYLRGYRDAKLGRESAIANEVALNLSGPNKSLDEWSGKWLTEGGMFVEIKKYDGANEKLKNTWTGIIYDELGNAFMHNLVYDDKGKSNTGKPFTLKERLSGTNKESKWPTYQAS